MKLVLFDIDGTLTHTVTTDEKCFSLAYEEALAIPGINTDWSVYSHCVDSTISKEIIQSRLGRLPQKEEITRLKEVFVSQLQACAQRDPASFLPVPGVNEVIDCLRVSGDWVAAIATGAWECSARFKLGTSGVRVNGIPLASADDGWTREEVLGTAILRAQAQYGCSRFERIVSVGDGIWDVLTAARMNLAFIGIAEGAMRERLIQAGARDVMENYLDQNRFIQLLAEAIPPVLK